jgi:hypothetical protein
MKCHCNHCSTPLEFEDRFLGENVECPECTLETALYDSGPELREQAEADRITKRILAEEKQRKLEIKDKKKRLKVNRVCKNCEQEVLPQTVSVAGITGCAMVIVWIIVIASLFVDRVAFALLFVITTVATLYIDRGPSLKCPACDSVELVPIDSPGGQKILRAQLEE